MVVGETSTALNRGTTMETIMDNFLLQVLLESTGASVSRKICRLQPDQDYIAAFVTMQGVPQKYGRNRENKSDRIIDAMRKYLSKHRPVLAELRGTFIAV